MVVSKRRRMKRKGDEVKMREHGIVGSMMMLDEYRGRKGKKLMRKRKEISKKER